MLLTLILNMGTYNMTEEIKQSYIREFIKFKDELMEQIKDYNSIWTAQVYGNSRLKEFYYNGKDKTGKIFVDGIEIDVTDYLK